MKSATTSRFPRPGVLGVLLLAAVLSACEASSCDLGPFPDSPFSSSVSPWPRCTDFGDSESIPTGTTLSPGSEPLSGDAATLAAFYNATDGPNWSDNTNWLTDAPISDWSGVSVWHGVTVSNIENGSAVERCVVRRLDLGFNQLSGEIPAELANLPNLEDLDLRGNQLSGEIPAELGNLSNLISLYLSFNQLSGEIPAELGNEPNLRSLDLHGNQLSGEIPAELGNLSNLESLDLGGNQLSGEIPAELGNLSNLISLDLGFNQLSGEIPAELGNLSNLEDLDLSFNQLSGEIPAELANLSNLEDLDLSFNQLSGEIPAELGNLPNLSLDGNQLSGRILRPNGINPQYAWDGSTILVSWDAVDGADYYKVYYDEISDSNCSPSRDGSPVVCEELAANVVGMSYLHENPSAVNNYYWVVACNSDGCSEIDSGNPAAPIEPIPAGPANVTYAVEGAAIRVTWEAVPGADYYKVFHDDFFDDNCSLSRDGSPRFCEELAANVVPTTFVHTSPAATDNYYWVVACNTGGCSDIDSKKPAKPIETRPNGPAATPSSTGGAGELAQERAAELLAGELGVAVAGLKVVSTTAMTWSDVSLGCPQPDMGYAQVVTPGYLVLFRDSEGTEYKVHTNEDGSSVIVCDK